MKRQREVCTSLLSRGSSVEVESGLDSVYSRPPLDGGAPPWPCSGGLHEVASTPSTKKRGGEVSAEHSSEGTRNGEPRPSSRLENPFRGVLPHLRAVSAYRPAIALAAAVVAEHFFTPPTLRLFCLFSSFLFFSFSFLSTLCQQLREGFGNRRTCAPARRAELSLRWSSLP